MMSRFGLMVDSAIGLRNRGGGLVASMKAYEDWMVAAAAPSR